MRGLWSFQQQQASGTHTQMGWEVADIKATVDISLI
jgi:hypothetical protein